MAGRWSSGSVAPPSSKACTACLRIPWSCTRGPGSASVALCTWNYSQSSFLLTSMKCFKVCPSTSLLN